MERAEEHVLAAARWLVGLAGTRMGPASRGMMLQAREGSGRVTVTSMSSRMMEGIVAGDAVAKALHVMLRGHVQEHGEQGHTCALFCASMVIDALGGSGDGLNAVPTHTAVQAMELARAWLGEYVGRGMCACSARIDLAGDCTHEVRAVVRGMVTPKRVAGLARGEVDAVCDVVTEAFFDSLKRARGPEATEGVWTRPDIRPPRVHSLLGAPPSASCLVQGLLLLERVYVPPAARDLPLRGSACRMVLFAVALEETDDWPWPRLCALVDSLCAFAHVVGCQMGMSEGVLGRFLHAGVLPLERLALSNMQALASLSGAEVVHALAPSVLESCVGMVGCLERKNMVNESYLHVLPPEHAALKHEGMAVTGEQGLATSGEWRARVEHVRTLVVAQRERVSLEELVCCVEATEKVLRRTALSASDGQTTVVAGGGCFEVHAAAYLRQRAMLARQGEGFSGPRSHKKAHARVAAAVEAVASSLLAVPAALNTRGIPSSAEVVNAIEAANGASLARQEISVRSTLSGAEPAAANYGRGEVLFGWDPVEGECTQVLGEGVARGVLDSWGAKSSALDTALAIAATLIRIERIVL